MIRTVSALYLSDRDRARVVTNGLHGGTKFAHLSVRHSVNQAGLSIN